MNRFQRILVVVDTRLDHPPALQQAVALAKQTQATLKVVDVIPEFAWTARLALGNHEQVLELMRKEKQEQLEAMIDPARQAGIDVTAKVLCGKTSIEVIREVLRDQHDLVMRVVKGPDSRQSGFFGSTATRLLRKCPCPVWLVKQEHLPDHPHVLACVETSSSDEADQVLNDQILDLAKRLAEQTGGHCSIVHAWSIWGEHIFKSRLQDAEFSRVERTAHDQDAQLLGRLLAKHGVETAGDHVHMIKGEAGNVIPEFAQAHHVDVVIMGTVARSGVAGLVMGNTAEQILRKLECSVLAIKPLNFRCPIEL